MDTINFAYLVFIHTPWWVYLLFAFFLKQGISALSESTYPIYRLVIMPSIFIIYSAHCLIISSQSLSDFLILFGTGLIAGLIIAYFNTPMAHISINDNNKHTISVPGSPYVLILLLCTLITKYILLYQLATKPEVIRNFAFNVILLTTTGLFTGLSIGRSTCLIYGYYKKKLLKNLVSVHS